MSFLKAIGSEMAKIDIELDDKRLLLSSLWQQGVKSVKGKECVKEYLGKEKILEGEYTLIAIGKAAGDMMCGALDVLGNNIKTGLVLTKHDHIDAELMHDGRIICHESSHPVPDESSLEAGRILLNFISQIPCEHQIIMMISGGASSLVEVLCDSCDLNGLRKINEWGLNNGLDINEMNYMRQKVSLIKGGKLQKYIANKKVFCLYISDVPEDNINVIGSGLLYKDKDLGNLINAQKKIEIDNFIKAAINIKNNDNDSLLKAKKVKGQSITHQIIANITLAKKAIYKHLNSFDKPVYMPSDSIDTDYETVAENITNTLKNAKDGVYIWGGEPTVTLPKTPGLGGRNQALALLLSKKIKSMEGISILVAGTDGTDGPTDAAGAFVSTNTYKLATENHLNPELAIENANAYPLFEQLDNLYKPGPTGTNVTDLVIAIKSSNIRPFIKT